jgi:glycosyltransferase involved in cell wall biosynthesis
MRLLSDATVLEYPATGVAKVTLGLYTACRRQDPSLEIVAVHRRPLSTPLPPGIRSSQWGRFLPPALWRRLHLPAAARRNRHAVMHFPWNGSVPPLNRSAIVLTTLHDVLPLIIPGYFRDPAAERQYRKERQQDIARTDLLLTDSEFSKREIVRNFRVRREPVVIPFGPTLHAGPPPSGPVGHSGYFLYVGGYNPRKGLQELLAAFLGLFREQKLRSTLILTGSKLHVSDTFRRLVDEGVGMGAVEERGYVSDDVLASLYANAVALVYPSQYEGFGLPPLEAMALGCPVITTQCTSLPEVCGDAAYYIDPADPASIGTSLVEFETKPELRALFTARGRKQAALFTWEKAAVTFLSALEHTIQARAAHLKSHRS